MDIETQFVHLVRLSLSSRLGEAASLARKTLPAILRERPDLATKIENLRSLLQGRSVRQSPDAALPVDLDSRLELLRREYPASLPNEPIWQAPLDRNFGEIILEREREQELLDAGLVPTRSVLFVGPPGVGKTLGAAYLAQQLDLPLLTLDLAAVMSSFLGRTGNNIRVVLDFAKKSPSLLLLDEFDAIAKRRDDSTEVGELKRLVTVILQSVDAWPPAGLLVAATNHGELLDPAVWRRFDRVIEFPLPTLAASRQHLSQLLAETPISPDQVACLAAVLEGRSFSDLARCATAIMRRMLIERLPVRDVVSEKISELCKNRDYSERLEVAHTLSKVNVSQRQISEITGVSRDTLRSRGIAVANPRKRTKDGKRE